MSEPPRIAFVVEGPTDFVILGPIVQLLLGNRDYEAVSIQPQLSEGFSAMSGGGWTGVYFWARQAAEQAGGALRNDPLFDTFDLLVVQIDADVSEKSYTDDNRIAAHPNDLPCSRPCPPPTATTNELRKVVLAWMGEADLPPRTVFCTPSKALETWIMVALFPQNPFCRSADLECRPNPAAPLQAQPLKQRLIRSGKKDIEKYRESAKEVALAWQQVRHHCTEAERFTVEFAAAIPN